MEFAETYRHEVIASRRDRSRRALFWSRIVGIVLMLTVAAVLRAEPEFRKALTTAGSDAIIAMMGRHNPTAPQAGALSPPTDAKEKTVQVSVRPRDRVKVNRPDLRQTAQKGFGEAIDAEALSREVGTQLQNMKLRP